LTLMNPKLTESSLPDQTFTGRYIDTNQIGLQVTYETVSTPLNRNIKRQ
jgi:hypothetical protein